MLGGGYGVSAAGLVKKTPLYVWYGGVCVVDEITPLRSWHKGGTCPKAAKLLLGVMHSVLRLGCPPKSANSKLAPREVFFATYMAQATLSCRSDNSPGAAA